MKYCGRLFDIFHQYARNLAKNIFQSQNSELEIKEIFSATLFHQRVYFRPNCFDIRERYCRTSQSKSISYGLRTFPNSLITQVWGGSLNSIGDPLTSSVSQHAHEIDLLYTLARSKISCLRFVLETHPPG